MRLRLGLPQEIVPVFWGMLLLEATFGAYLGVWPLWIEELGAPVAIIGLILGSGGFLRLGVIFPSSRISHRFGYRNSILGCRTITGVGLLAAGFATHWTLLFFTVMCSAIGELVFPLIQTLVVGLSGDQRMRSFALIFTVGPSIALIGAPLVSGVLVHFYGMRAAFFFAAACTFASLYFLKEIREPKEGEEHAHLVTSSYREAWNDPGVKMVTVLLAATVFALSLGVSFIPTFLENVRGLSPALIDAIAAASAVGSACFGLATARIHRMQRYPFHAIAFAIATIGCSFVLFHTTAYLPVLVLAYFMRGGMFSAWAMLSAAMGDLAPVLLRARAFALCEMASGVAYAFGPIIAAPLYSQRSTLSLEVAFVLCAILVPIMIVAQKRGTAIKRSAAAHEAAFAGAQAIS